MLDDLRRRIETLPGVQSAFVTTGFPIDGQFEKEFLLDSTSHESARVEGRWAGPGYFHTLAIPVLYGRVFDERDAPEWTEEVVVSEAFARRMFGTSNAVGKRLRFADADVKPIEIIGVVGNARSIDFVADTPKRFLYRSAVQAGVMPTTIVARTSRNEASLVCLIQQEVRQLHPELPVTEAMTMRQLMGIAVGSVLSWAGVAVLESSVTQIAGINLIPLGTVALGIVGSAAAAAYVPARRAVLTDPIAAIHHH